MADLRNSRRLKQLAGILVERCRAAGVSLFPDKAVEILAMRVKTTAMGLRISERYTLDRYFDEESVEKLADKLVRQVEENRRLADGTPPLTLSVEDAARICAAFGMAVKIAVQHPEDPDSSALINKAGDAVTLFGFEMADAVAGEITLTGQDVMYPRTVLTQVLGKLRSGEWSCICEADHEAGRCALQDGLVNDLGRLGSWISEEAPPEDARSPERLLRAAREQIVESLGLGVDDVNPDSDDDDDPQRPRNSP